MILENKIGLQRFEFKLDSKKKTFLVRFFLFIQRNLQNGRPEY